MYERFPYWTLGISIHAKGPISTHTHNPWHCLFLEAKSFRLIRLCPAVVNHLQSIQIPYVKLLIDSRFDLSWYEGPSAILLPWLPITVGVHGLGLFTGIGMRERTQDDRAEKIAQKASKTALVKVHTETGTVSASGDLECMKSKQVAKSIRI